MSNIKNINVSDKFKIEKRLRRIVELIKQKKYASADYLLDALKNKSAESINISPRQLKTDIAKLSTDYYADIVYDKRNKGYCIKNEDFSLDSILDSKQLKSIHFAVKSLESLKDLAIYKSLLQAFDRLNLEIKAKKFDAQQSHIHFEISEPQKNSELIERILEAIEQEYVITFDYTKFGENEKPKKHILYAYALKEHQNRWYVIGWQPEQHYRYIKTYGLDRISNLQIDENKFIPDDKNIGQPFDAKKYFENDLGITVNLEDEVSEIILQVSPTQWQYLESKPIHHSQKKIDENEKGIYFALKLRINHELVMEILKYGSNMRVISPLFLAEEVKNSLAKALEQY